ncbi:MAG: lecithin retinol acyltransferase family protein [Clostridioides difficile]|nr:lecithin retinol acyltransferase family protein [Clostridioides difficile]
MGMPDSLFKKDNTDNLSGLIIIEVENRVGQLIKSVEETKKFLKEYRKDIEDKAEELHPTCGKIVRTVNNINDTVENLEDSIINGIGRTLFSEEVKDLELADHLFVQRVGYTHHGLYIGNRKVIHYLAECIREDSLETFADGAKIYRKSEIDSPRKYIPEECIRRAFKRFSEDKYNLLINNCESFVRWCRSGGIEY